MSENDNLLTDRLLAEAADLPPPRLEEGFLARVLQDAAREQPPMPMPVRSRPQIAQPNAKPSRQRGGWFGALAEVFGGPAVLAGLMLATIIGVYIGLAQPAVFSNLTGYSFDSPLDSLDVFSGGDSLWTEAAQ